MSGVGEIAERRGLAPRLLERREPFLARAYDLCEDLLQLAREGEIAELGSDQLQPKGANRLRGELGEPRA